MTIQEVKDILTRNGVEFEEVPRGVSWRSEGVFIGGEDWRALKTGGFEWFGSLSPSGELSSLRVRIIDPKIAS